MPFTGYGSIFLLLSFSDRQQPSLTNLLCLALERLDQRNTHSIFPFPRKTGTYKNLMLIQRKTAATTAEIWQLPSAFLHLVSCCLPCRLERGDCPCPWCNTCEVCKEHLNDGMIRFNFYLNACQVGFESAFSIICWCYSHGSV